MRSSVEGSLKRLQVDVIDLLQLHCIPIEALREQSIFDWLRKLKDEGLIRNFGASVETVEEGLLCLEQEGITSLQVIFNVLRQKLITDLFPTAMQKGVGIIARVPLASGLLSGKFTKETTFAKDDHRNFNRDGNKFNVGETFAGIQFDRGIEIVEMIRDLLPEPLTMAQMALRWILDHDAVTTVIPGATSSRQAVQNAMISDLAPLPEELHTALSTLYTEQIHRDIRGPY